MQKIDSLIVEFWRAYGHNDCWFKTRSPKIIVLNFKGIHLPS